MATTSNTKPDTRSAVFNLPNQLTVLRLLLAIVLFGLIAWKMFLASFVVFVVAASTDWLDGYFARKYGMVTLLGRILDPFVDKIIICGSFIFLVAEQKSGISAWMAVVVVGRELLITALRSYLEQQGADFSATMSGKLKMVAQCLAVGFSLFYLTCQDRSMELSAGWRQALDATIWGAVLLTIYSGLVYVQRAIGLFRQ
jgi:CDP-diacylglycerol--glycerol-3-phosphate 3-phosphatidyltransferase